MARPKRPKKTTSPTITPMPARQDTSPTQPKLPENKFPLVVKKKMGRPEEYSEYTARYICGELSKGRTLIKICEEEDMPARNTVLDWMDRHPDFSTAYRRARDRQMDYWGEELVTLADGATADNYKVVDLRSKNRMWVMARLKAQTWGDKVTQEITGPGGGAVQHQVATVVIKAEDLTLDARESLRAALLLSGKTEDEGE